MIYFSLGLPGPFSEWCDTLLARMTAASGRVAAFMLYPSTDEEEMDILDRAGLEMVHGNVGHLVIGARQFDDKLKAVLAETGAPFILAMDDPRAYATALVAQGHDWASATRHVANLCPMLMEFAELEGAYLIPLEYATSDPLAWAFTTCSRLGITLDLDQVRDILAQMKAEGLVPTGAPISVPAEMIKMVNGALEPYAWHFVSAPFKDICWTRGLFSLAKEPGVSPIHPIDLRETANGRFLVFGPYMSLPHGYWSAKIILGISPEAVGQTFFVDVFSARQLGVTEFSPREGGVFTAALDFSYDATCGPDIEIRVLIGRDSAPGQVAFGQAILHPISLNHGKNVITDRADFMTALNL